MAGAVDLFRIAVRRDRIVVPAWIAVIVVLLAASAGSVIALYPTEEQRIAYATIAAANVVARAFDGPMAGTSLGAITITETYGIMAVLVGIMSVLTVVRHTRQEEETGRAELIRSAAVGRHAALAAGLTVAAAANVAVGVATTLTFVAFGLPAGGAVAGGLALAGAGISFAALGAVACQLASSQRTARGLGAAAVGVAFLLRAVGDATGHVAPSGVDVVSAWPSWLSPIGWGQQVRAFGGERWWVLTLYMLLALAATATSVALTNRRDFGGGIVKDRRGPPTASPLLSSPTGLAFRLHRGVWLAYVVGLAAVATAFGAIGDEAEELVGTSDELAALFETLGEGALVELFFAFFMGILAVATAAFTVQALLRARAEEADGRAEPILAAAVSRPGWLLSHVAISALGTATILLVAGLAAGTAYSLATGDAGRLADIVGAALIHVPAALTLGGFVVLTIGLVPRATVALGWSGLVASLVVGQLGALFDLPQWLLNISPFTHTPAMPADDFALIPVVLLLAVGATLAIGGLAALRRRDLTAGA